MIATVQTAERGTPYWSAVDERPVKSNIAVSWSRAPMSVENEKNGWLVFLLDLLAFSQLEGIDFLNYEKGEAVAKSGGSV